jgi:uncharacterized delta-60 repeat protein
MKHIPVSILGLLFWGNLLMAQSGTLDSSFANNGVLLFEKSVLFPSYSVGTIVDQNRRVIAFQKDYGDSSLTLSRFLENGSLDPAFGQNGGAVFLKPRTFEILAGACQQDNKILLTGYIEHTSGGNRQDVFITRFLENGQPDTSFGNTGNVIIELDTTAYALGMAVQNDGKILLTGYLGISWAWAPTNSDLMTLRLLPDGTLDPSFGDGGIVITDLTDSGYDVDMGSRIFIQPDGKIFVSGRNGTGYNSIGDLALIRYMPDGTLDNSFGNGGIVITEANIPNYSDVFFKDDHAILVAGGEGDVFSGGSYATLRQFKSDGRVDSIFAENGIFKSSPQDNGRGFTDLDVQSDGKIVTSGYWGDNTGTGNGLLMRFNPNGKPDSTFGTGGMVLLEMDGCSADFRHLWFLPDQKITVLGICADYWIDSTYQIFWARFNNDISNGTLNPSSPEILSIFPNPATDMFFLKLTDENPRPEARLRLLNAQGKVVFEKTGVSNFETVRTAGFVPGVYFLEMTDGVGLVARKVLVIHP